MNKPFHAIRKQYTRGELLENQVSGDPLKQLENWLADALAADCPEPTAMVLSTAGRDLRPSSRVVLMKGIDERGITFFTNYLSRKGLQIGENPFASVLFFWPELERQVRIEGRVEKVSPEVSDIYFDSRPAESRISAATSPQSQEIPSRDWLDKRVRSLGVEEVSRPEHWGGYLLVPDYFEFWQGRPNRLHDRLIYKPSGSGWTIGRLAP